MHPDRHLTRMVYGLKLLRFPLPDFDAITDQMRRLCVKNDVREGALRLTLSRGPAARGLARPEQPETTCVITTHSDTSPLRPARMDIARFHKDETSPLTRVKHTNYLPAIFARMEAAENGFDDVVFLTSSRHVSEASASNIIVLTGDGLITPPLSDGALPGISRARLIEEGICREKSITVEGLKASDGAWLSTSLSIRPIESLQTHRLTRSHSWTEKLESFLFPLRPDHDR